MIELRDKTAAVRKGTKAAFGPKRTFELIEEKKWDDSEEDKERHDVTDENAAYQLATLQYPGKFGVFYEADRPSSHCGERSPTAKLSFPANVSSTRPRSF